MPDGTTVYLRYIRVGRRMFTAPAWLTEFFAASSSQDRQRPVRKSRRERQREKEHKRTDKQMAGHLKAESVLDREGI